MIYNGNTLTESALIVSFLLDNQPKSAILPLPTDPDGPLARYRLNFLVDTYFTKVNPLMFKMVGAATPDIQTTHVNSILKIVSTEIQPLLANKTGPGPFFNGSTVLTYAEVMIAPFVLRLYDWADDVIWPRALAEGFEKLPVFDAWAKVCMQHESVMYVYDKAMRLRIHERLPRAKAKYADA